MWCKYAIKLLNIRYLYFYTLNCSAVIKKPKNQLFVLSGSMQGVNKWMSRLPRKKRRTNWNSALTTWRTRGERFCYLCKMLTGYRRMSGTEGFTKDRLERAVPSQFSLSSSFSAKTRLAALESLRQAFSSRLLYDFLMERRLTVSDCLERSLKKGNTKSNVSISFNCIASTVMDNGMFPSCVQAVGRSSQQQPRSSPCSASSWGVATRQRRASRCFVPSSLPSWLTVVPV